jgi:hypothetical protein
MTGILLTLLLSAVASMPPEPAILDDMATREGTEANVAESGAPAYELALRTRPPAFSDCGWCKNCVDPDRHSLANGNYDRRFGELNHPCGSAWGAGTCSERHGESSHCTGDDDPGPGPPPGQSGGFKALDRADQEHLWTLVTVAALEDLQPLLDQFDGAIQLNGDREAIQAFGCNGEIILNIPLEPEQFSALERAE